MINIHLFMRLAKLFFILTSVFISNHGMAREPYLNGGHFSGLNNEWTLEQTGTAQNTDAMTPNDRASRNCDWPANDKPGTQDNQNEKTGANETGVR